MVLAVCGPDAAVAFGVSPQLFYQHETEIVESGVFANCAVENQNDWNQA